MLLTLDSEPGTLDWARFLEPPTLDPGLRIYALNSGLGTMDS